MTKFRFRFDARGMRLATLVPAAPQATADFAPKTEAPGPDPVVLINDLKEWIEENHAFGLDMQLLEERDVLMTPPYWSYVAEAAASIVRGEVRETGVAEEQQQAVEKYAAMMIERERLINHALALAAFASIASTAADPAQRMRDGISALPKGGKLDEVVLPRMPDYFLVQARLPFDAYEWAEAIRTYCASVILITELPDWNILEKTSWEHWRTRFKEYRAGRRSHPVDANDLWLRVRSVGPPALFRNELGEMTLREWSNALLKIRATTVPSWVKQEIERELGLVDRDTVLLIVGWSSTSLTAQWLPSKRYGCFWIDRSIWASEAPAMRFEKRGVVAFEIANYDETTLRTRWDGFNVAPASQYVFLGPDKLPPTAAPILPYVEAPKGVDDAISKIEALLKK